MFVQSSPREKRGESYPREFTRLSQLNPNQLWRELERMGITVATRGINFGILIKIPQKVELDLP